MAPTRRSFLAQSVGALGAMAILPELSYSRPKNAAKLNIGLIGATRRHELDDAGPAAAVVLVARPDPLHVPGTGRAPRAPQMRPQLDSMALITRNWPGDRAEPRPPDGGRIIGRSGEVAGESGRGRCWGQRLDRPG